MELRAPPLDRLSARGRGVLLAVLVAGALAAWLAPPAQAAADLDQPESKRRPPPAFELSAREAIELARRTEAVEGERRSHPGLEPTAYTSGPGRWQVSFTAGGDELAQVHVDDATGTVTEAWTGPQVAWKMARGYAGAFGRTLNAPYVWLPLCLLFVAPFVDPRRPFRLLHLDLLVMLAFGVSHFFFNRGEIFASVPLVYPVLGYLLARMLVAGFRPRGGAGPLVPVVPIAWLALALVFLVGFRVALNVADSNVIDVGYAGVIGADRIADGEGIYEGELAEDNQHGNTYGPLSYLAYVPFEQALPWSGTWDDLPAAHAAAIAFDAATMLGLLLLGIRLRRGAAGRALGTALAFAWASYPYSLFVLSSNSNDSLVAMLVVFALLAITSAPARGALLALATATKFAPLALAPLFARGVGDAQDEGRPRSGRRPVLLFTLVFAAVAAACIAAFIPDGGLREVYDRTIGYQTGRESPFSIWGQEPALGGLQLALVVAAAGLAISVAFVPRRRSPAQVAALGAAVLIAVQLVATHWFYLYVVWFAPFVLVALFAAHETGPSTSEAERAAESRRSKDEPAPDVEPVPA